MKKKILLGLMLCSSLLVSAQVYKSTESKVDFKSTTPMEDIEAENKKAKAAVRVKDKLVMVQIKIISFKFEKPLMEEHFNEKYMETEKYPNASFNGNIVEDVDLTKDGTYEVNVKGKLKIHGVEQERTLKGTIVVANGKLDLKTSFKVKLKDHKIKVPKVVVANIAEVIDVNAHFVCESSKKK